MDCNQRRPCDIILLSCSYHGSQQRRHRLQRDISMSSSCLAHGRLFGLAKRYHSDSFFGRGKWLWSVRAQAQGLFATRRWYDLLLNISWALLAQRRFDSQHWYELLAFVAFVVPVLHRFDTLCFCGRSESLQGVHKQIFRTYCWCRILECIECCSHTKRLILIAGIISLNPLGTACKERLWFSSLVWSIIECFVCYRRKACSVLIAGMIRLCGAWRRMCRKLSLVWFALVNFQCASSAFSGTFLCVKSKKKIAVTSFAVSA